MAKFLFHIILLILAGFAVQVYLPFWSLTLIAAAIAFFFRYENSITSFLAGFIAGGLLWYVYAYFIDAGNQGLLAGRIGELYQTSGTVIGYLTGLIGGVLAGLGSLTGYLAASVLLK